MPRTNTCPSVGQLQQFVTRALSPQAAEDLARHVEQCPHCGMLVDQFLGGDTITEAIPQTDNPETMPLPAVGGLLDQVRELQPSPSANVPSELAAQAAAPTDLAAALALLAPPERPDELGRLGGYRILKIIGMGGMGLVFRAEDPFLERMLAVKTIRPGLGASRSARARFLREAKTAASLKHDNIVTIYQVGEDRGAPFIAMEFLDGESLGNRLKRQPRLPLDDVLRIGIQVASALAAAHARGIIHRDIKPANIWLEDRRELEGGESRAQRREPGKSREPRDERRETQHVALDSRPSGSALSDSGLSSLDAFRVRLLDFGLSRSLDDQSNVTQPGLVLGTPAFTAPEQALEGAVDHRCDLFSLGAVLYLLATGKSAFAGKDQVGVLLAVSSKTPLAPSAVCADVPRPLSDLVMKLLAKDPAQRPQSAREVLDALHRIHTDAQTICFGELPGTLNDLENSVGNCLAGCLLYEAHGISFQYPSNWKWREAPLDAEQQSWRIKLVGPYGWAFIDVLAGQADALENFKAQIHKNPVYQQVQGSDFSSDLAGAPAKGFRYHARADQSPYAGEGMAVQMEGKTLLLSWQAHLKNRDLMELGFQNVRQTIQVRPA